MKQLLNFVSVLTLVAALFTFSGCIGRENPALGSEKTTTEQTTNTSSKTQMQKPDFSSPEAAVRTFVRAAIAKDVDLLAKCVHKDCAEEFKTLLNKSTSDEMIKQLAEMFTDAEVGDAKEEKIDAHVAVKLTSRDEVLTMRKSDAGWQLVDF